MNGETKEVRLENLVPFEDSQGQTYNDGWMKLLMVCIDKAGLTAPIVARPASDGKYEVLSGYNRVKAMELLGCEVIRTDIRCGLTDDKATELYYNSLLEQQLFSDLSFAQKFEIVKICEKFIKENSRQGRRTDLENKTTIKEGEKVDGTYSQPAPSLEEMKNTCYQLVPTIKKANNTCSQPIPSKSKNPIIRDNIAQCLGISPTTFDKYIRIIKLPDKLSQSVVRLLDENKITFEAAYAISNMIDSDLALLIEEIDENPKRKLYLDRLDEYPKRNSKEAGRKAYPISKERIQKIFLPPDLPAL